MKKLKIKKLQKKRWKKNKNEESIPDNSSDNQNENIIRNNEEEENNIINEENINNYYFKDDDNFSNKCINYMKIELEKEEKRNKKNIKKYNIKQINNSENFNNSNENEEIKQQEKTNIIYFNNMDKDKESDLNSDLILKSKKSNIEINDLIKIEISIDEQSKDKNIDNKKNDFIKLEIMNENNNSHNKNEYINKIKTNKINNSFNIRSNKNNNEFDKNNISSNNIINNIINKMYPDFGKKEKIIDNKLNLSLKILEDKEDKNPLILKNDKNVYKKINHNIDIVNNINSCNNNIYLSKKNNLKKEKEKKDIKDIMKIYNLLLEEKYELLKNKEYFIINEIEDKKNYVGNPNILYEICFVNSANDKIIKCNRKYKHFYLLNELLKKKYPYIIIPQLPPRKNVSQIIISDRTLDENRLYQLNFYINFIFYHENLRNTKEFFKFIEESKIDVKFFSDNSLIFNSNIIEDLDLDYMNDNCLDEITPKKKIFSLCSSIKNAANFFEPKISKILGSKKREIDDNELIIKKMDKHFHNIIHQYTELSKSIDKVLKSIEKEANANKISEGFLYLKDCFIHLDNYNEIMINYSNQTKILSERQIESFKKASKLKHKLSTLINLLNGICYTLEKYLNFISKYNYLNEKITKTKKRIKNNEELTKIYEDIKNKFEIQLSKETEIYCQIYEEMTFNCLCQFREVLESSTMLKNKDESNEK